jgi:hypothetical protein
MVTSSLQTGHTGKLESETEVMRNALPLATATILLLAVDWFAFHDLGEPHTFRDYLTLVASMLVFFHFGLELLEQANRLRLPKSGLWWKS